MLHYVTIPRMTFISVTVSNHEHNSPCIVAGPKITAAGNLAKGKRWSAACPAGWGERGNLLFKTLPIFAFVMAGTKYQPPLSVI